MRERREAHAYHLYRLGGVVRRATSAPEPPRAVPRPGRVHRLRAADHLRERAWCNHRSRQRRSCTSLVLSPRPLFYNLHFIGADFGDFFRGVVFHPLPSFGAPHPTIRQYVIQKLFELSAAAAADPSLLPEAQRLQGIVAQADFTIAKASIAGTKALLEKLYGYGGLTRRPLPAIDPEAAAALWEHPHTQDIVRVERELSGKVAA